MASDRGRGAAPPRLTGSAHLLSDKCLPVVKNAPRARPGPAYDRGMPHGAIENVSGELGDLLGDRFVTTQAAREHHGRDESPLPPALPDAVAWPESAAEISQILRTCSSRSVPVIPFGAGTSLEGHVLATSGGLCLDLSRMNEIVSVNVDDLDVTVQPGVTRLQLEDRLAREGLFFPVDPGADATLGGMTATGASGTTTVRYGAMRENVLSLEVVLPDGRIIRTGRRARKSSAGYDLTHLFVGSEGTLGVISEISLRIYGIPEAISAAVTNFNTVEDAVRTVITTLQTGIPVARAEFLDELAIKAVNGYSGLDYPVAPTLFFEFHGSESAVVEDANNVQAIAAEHGALEFNSALEEKERVKLWRARHDHFFASLNLRPSAHAITTDACVPISKLAECIVESKKDIERASLLATTAGHVGDGNFHLMLLVDPDDEREIQAAEDVGSALVKRALAMGGTCTGEHGIGIRKISALNQEMGAAVDLMRSLKQAVDPTNIMNPGKVMPVIT